MNTEVAINILVKVLIALGSGVAAKYGISDAGQQQIAYALAGAIVAAVAAIYGVWSHWNMKKVPQGVVALWNATKELQKINLKTPDAAKAAPTAAQAVRPAGR